MKVKSREESQGYSLGEDNCRAHLNVNRYVSAIVARLQATVSP